MSCLSFHLTESASERKVDADAAESLTPVRSNVRGPEIPAFLSPHEEESLALL